GSSSYQPEPPISRGIRSALRTPISEISRASPSVENRRRRPRLSSAPHTGHARGAICPALRSRRDLRNGRLQRAYRLGQLPFLVLSEPAEGVGEGGGGQSGELAPEFDALDKFPALLQDPHQGKQGRHDLATPLKVLLDNAGSVEREMFLGQAVAGT